MQNKNYRASAKEKRWISQVAELPCVSCGFQIVEIHHPAGVMAKFNKQHIGPWWLIPLCNRCHGLVTRCSDDLSMSIWGFPLVGRWDAEKILFTEVLEHFHEGSADQEYPSEDVIKAIKGFRR